MFTTTKNNDTITISGQETDGAYSNKKTQFPEVASMAK